MPLMARLQDAVEETVRLQRQFLEEQGPAVLAAARMLASVLGSGGRVFIFGNGGSAADAQHLAAEFVNRFQVERPPLAALALTTDTSILTAVANDYDFSEVFAKQLQALGRPGDVAWGISTSGGSPNVLQGLKKARELGLKTLALGGRDGGEMAPLADVALIVRSRNTPRVQEVHITIGHVLCDLVDFQLYPEKFGEKAGQ
ncbi:MAG: D-sedoheptulose 7-phosphate isomerase [Deltaproteobacteria bacterium]|nr:D-sedoheptulose 7-phosphate isomerase [Deltaproteobacteria bacterium]MBI4796941.1 D-sedoheptulose 7-phosphate isomerase [Deltaproteobacteria bacterium]